MSAEVTYLQVLQYQNNIVTTELGSYIYTTVLTLKGNLVTTSNATLFYIHDPMCSWCWGFRPVWEQLEQQLSTTVKIVYIVGGLAPDSDQPMAIPMQQTLAATWQRIQQHIPGTEFNYDFWRDNSKTQPRRSTYPSCRAVLAAKIQNPELEKAMILSIQQAYFLHTKNPSNIDVLTDIATSIGLEPEQFRDDMASQTVEMQLQEQLQLARGLSVQGFPSLVLSNQARLHAIPVDYNNSHTMQQAITDITHPVNE